jgi:phage terminase large subunit-like protein
MAISGADDALTDEPPAPSWDLSCLDWKKRLLAGTSLVPTLPLDAVRAARAVSVFKKLRIADVPGQPTFGESGGPWIFDIVAAMFGAFDKVTAMRMIRGLFLLVPKKNAKTTYGAGIMMTALILNERPMAEMLLTGPSQEISDKAYSQAKGMIALDREGYLQSRFRVRDHVQTIEDLKAGAKLKIKTFAADIVTGGVPAAALIDEVHLLGRDQKAAAVIQQLTGGMVSVPEAFWGMITTQSFVPPAGVFKANLNLARGIRDGRVKGIDTLPVLYEYPEEMQKDRAFWEDPVNWPMITPNLGKSIWIPRLVKDLAEVREKGEDEVRIWISQHLNIEMGLGLHTDRWAGALHWEPQADTSLTIQEIIARSDALCLGADGGGLDDLLGLALLGRDAETRKWLLWTHGWAHQSVLERRKEIAPALLDFEKQGDLTIVKDLGQDVEEMRDIFAEVVASGLLFKLGVDPAGVGAIVDAAQQAGIEEDQIVGISQGWKLSGAIKTAERALADGTLVHAGQPIMAWCVGNARVEPRGNAITITKQTAGTAKIDLLMATLNAVTLMTMNPQTQSVETGFFDLSKV